MMNKIVYPPAWNLSSNSPARMGKNIPAVEPAVLPNPIRDATARFGNMSDAVE